MSIRTRIARWIAGPEVQKREWSQRDPTWALAGLLKGQDALADPYTQHVWCYACIKAIATNIAAAPWRLYNGPADDARPIETGALYNVFNRPTPFWTRYHLWEATVSHLKCCGNAIWVLKRETPKQPPNEIAVFGRDGWDVKLDANSRITSYTLQRNAQTFTISPEQIVHFRTWNPRSDIWGMGEIEAARMSAEQDFAASIYNRSFFTNSAMPGGIIKVPSGSMLTDDQWKAIKANWNDMHAGPSKAFRLASLEGGAEFEQISLSHRDMMFLEQRKWNRGEILACFKVPPSELGIFDDVQKAVQESVERGFWNKTLLPVCSLIEDTLRAQFFMQLDNEATWGKFDTSGVAALQQNKAELITQAQQLWAMGMPLNAANEYLGLDMPEVEGGDIGYLPMSVLPTDMVLNPPAPEPPPPAAPTVPPETPEPDGAPDEDEDPEDDAEAKAAPTAVLTRDALPHTAEQAADWEAFVRALNPSERGMQESVRLYLMRVKTWLAEQLAGKADVADIPVDALMLSDKWDAELKSLAGDHYRKIAETMKPRVEARLKKVGIDFELNLKDKRLVEFLRGKEIKIVDINDRIRTGVREALAEAQETTLTVNELQESIFSVMQDSRARALRIARTETTSAANGVEYVSHNIAGVKTHMWLAALDENTRDSHLACMREGDIAVGTKFSNGLRFPGDPSGEAGEVVNCRCSLIPVE
jgi:HK97 family phage portal protein